MLYKIVSFISSPFQLLICSYPVLMVNKLCVEIHIFVLVEPQIYPYISRFARVDPMLSAPMAFTNFVPHRASCTSSSQIVFAIP